MKKSPCVYWCLVVLAFSPVIKAESQLPKEAAFWQQAVAGSSLVEIAKTMRDTTNPWPQVDAAKSAPSWQVDLINQLHRIIKQSFDPNALTNPDEAKAYLQIAKVLTDAGGYSNILLADSLYRLVIFRAAQDLSSSFENRGKVESFVRELPAPSLGIKERLTSFAKDDPSLAQRISVIDGIAPSDNLYVISQQLLVKDNADADRVDSGNLTFSNLMANPSGFGLTFRIAQTEMLATVSLKALLEFIKQGGTLSELDPADVTRFKKRMSNSKGDYRYPALGKRRLSVDDPLGVLQISTDLNTKRAFLNTALE
jgi:hypothetical protein